MRVLWQIFGWLNVGLGAFGTVVPLVPTTPFLLVAAWSFARSSDRFHDWLLNHKQLGPPILAWRRERAISPRVKLIAALSLVASFLIALLAGVPSWALGLQATILIAVATFILTRPGGARQGKPPTRQSPTPAADRAVARARG